MSEFFENNKKKIYLILAIILGALLLYITIEQIIFFAAASPKVDRLVKSYYKAVSDVNINFYDDTEDVHKEKTDKLFSYLNDDANNQSEYKKIVALQNTEKAKGGNTLSYDIENLSYRALRKNPFKDTVDVTVLFKTNIEFQNSADYFDGSAFGSVNEKEAGIKSEGENKFKTSYYKVSMKIKKINGEYKIIDFSKREISDTEIE